jgi:hypothetical protein
VEASKSAYHRLLAIHLAGFAVECSAEPGDDYVGLAYV